MDFDIEKFSYRLIVLMEEFNMTQIKLSKEIGTSNVTISRYLSGDRIPRLDVVMKIASVFHVSLDYLLGVSENKEFSEETIHTDLNISLLAGEIYSLDKNSPLSKKQIKLIKNLLLANKDFILSA